MGYIAWLRPGYAPLMERWLSVPRRPRLTFSVFPFREGPRVRIPSLQRRVCLASAFHAYRRKDPAFARSVNLDVTRERDVLATSRLALAAFL